MRHKMPGSGDSTTRLRADDFDNNYCASVDSDGDDVPDALINSCTTDATAPEMPGPTDSTTRLSPDAFPMNYCASVDSDGDDVPDELINSCTTAANAPQNHGRSYR